MSDINIPRLFKKKVDEHASDLCVAVSDVYFDAPNNRYVQLFGKREKERKQVPTKPSLSGSENKGQ